MYMYVPVTVAFTIAVVTVATNSGVLRTGGGQFVCIIMTAESILLRDFHYFNSTHLDPLGYIFIGNVRCAELVSEVINVLERLTV